MAQLTTTWGLAISPCPCPLAGVCPLANRRRSKVQAVRRRRASTAYKRNPALEPEPFSRASAFGGNEATSPQQVAGVRLAYSRFPHVTLLRKRRRLLRSSSQRTDCSKLTNLSIPWAAYSENVYLRPVCRGGVSRPLRVTRPSAEITIHKGKGTALDVRPCAMNAREVADSLAPPREARAAALQAVLLRRRGRTGNYAGTVHSLEFR